ncbi:MAG: hypothetical protein MAG453_00836 [Calditrichaeota bacterium]|nr:hypothetical protein [Calditrichota bacterium]
MRVIAVFGISIGLALSAMGQPQLGWETIFGHPQAPDNCWGVTIGTDDAFFLQVNYSMYPAQARFDYNGNLINYNTIGPRSWVTSVPGGGYVGAVDAYSTLLKVSIDLSVLWSLDYPDDGTFEHTTVTDLGNYVTVVESGEGPSTEGHILRISPGGVILNDIQIDDPDLYAIVRAYKKVNGNYLVSAYRTNAGYLAEVDQSGSIIWDTEIDSSDFYNAGTRDFYPLPDGMWIARTTWFQEEIPDVIWIDDEGNFVDTYFVTGEYVGYDFHLLPDGGFILNTWSYVSRHDAQANIIWQHDYFGDLDPDLYNVNEIVPKGFEGFIGAGRVERFQPPNTQCYLFALGPDTAPIRVVAEKTNPGLPVEPGTAFSWLGRVHNRGDEAVTLDVWTVARTPSVQLVGPLRLWENITVQPGEQLEATLAQYVPGYAPAGDYNYILRVGDYPDHTYEAYFPFEVVAGASQAQDRPAVARNRGLDAGQATAASDDPRGQARTAGTSGHWQARTGNTNGWPGSSDPGFTGVPEGTSDPDWRLDGQWTRVDGMPEVTAGEAPAFLGEIGGSSEPGLAVAPNPFNAMTTIRVTVPDRETSLRVAVYDITGREVTVLHDGPPAAGVTGTLTFTFDGSRRASGVYFVHATVGSETRTEKLVLVR